MVRLDAEGEDDRAICPCGGAMLTRQPDEPKRAAEVGEEVKEAAEIP
jgi:hypothetical protein